jgi:FG-GAP repeat protein
MRLGNLPRAKLEDLPQAEQELTPEEAKEVQGGVKFTPFGGFQGGIRVAQADVNNDGTDDILVGAQTGG